MVPKSAKCLAGSGANAVRLAAKKAQRIARITHRSSSSANAFAHKRMLDLLIAAAREKKRDAPLVSIESVGFPEQKNPSGRRSTRPSR